MLTSILSAPLRAPACMPVAVESSPPQRQAGGAVTSAPTAWPKALKASPKAVPAFVNWTPAREKRPGPAVRAPRFVGEAAPGVFGVLGVWALGLGEKGVCWVARFCGVVLIVPSEFKAANLYYRCRLVPGSGRSRAVAYDLFKGF